MSLSTRQAQFRGAGAKTRIPINQASICSGGSNTTRPLRQIAIEFPISLCSRNAGPYRLLRSVDQLTMQLRTKTSGAAWPPRRSRSATRSTARSALGKGKADFTSKKVTFKVTHASAGVIAAIEGLGGKIDMPKAEEPKADA